ncbi:hypothetical protein FKW77_004418 [Venturia effusa]|uniref:Subtelomeric hrmA-associated cluster protein AFUB-079030/YDR124W-like helical bundle domain-containing protein n=1 Tax=Venturia effusa TaxID=50376 RepID=A0A517L366_9PEZI|nr:hypothetical protein FKW77_004418 [Venturia effusa]
MAIGNEVDSATFSDAFFCNSSGKKHSNAVAQPPGFGMIQFDPHPQFNPSSTPLSGESTSRPGQLARRSVTTIQPAPQQPDHASPVDVCSRAKERLDASARHHRPWALITTDERGNAQAILSNSRDEGFLHKMQQVFHSNKLTASLLQANDFDPGLYSIPSALHIGNPTASHRRNDSEQGHVRVGKRSAASLDQDSPSLEDDDQQCNVVSTVTLTLGAADAILAFFTTTFKAIQQQALKQILKAWIKELEPHKQKHHPYKGKVLPPYWPEQVGFVEPDHQRTEDRIAVAIHIIKFVQTDPKWASSNGIDILESSTNSIKLQFDDEPQEKFHKRKILLKQLYDVARQQSLVLKDEKDGDVPIAYQDPMETMRIKRQPRAKRQKTGIMRDLSETCEHSPISQSQSPDMSGETFVGSSTDVSPASVTPMNSLSPPYAAHFQPELEQHLQASHSNSHWDPAAFSQHRAATPQWSPTEFSQPLQIQNQMTYGVPPTMPQQPFSFTLPGCSPPAVQTPTPAPFESSPTDIEQYYTNQTQSPTHLNFNAISLSHGLGPTSDVKMAAQPTTAYNAWIEEPRWDPTPGSFDQQYQPPPNNQSQNY